MLHRDVVGCLLMVIILIAVLARHCIVSHIETLSFAFVAFQFLFVSLWYISGPIQDFKLRYGLTYDYANSFSKSKNVLLLVIDSLSNADFEKMLANDDKLKDCFEGFTFYKDCVGAYPYTRGAVPHILTGLFEDNSKTLSESVATHLELQSIPAILRNIGFRTEAYGFGVPYVLHSAVWDNITGSPCNMPTFFDMSRVIFQLGLKITPVCVHKYLIKLWLKAFPRWKGPPYWGISFPAGIYDVSRIEEIEEKAVADCDSRVFKYEHFWGGHMPYLLDESTQFRDPSYAMRDRDEQVKAALKLVCRYLAVLKRLHIFDNSLIFILGDHGLVEQEAFPMMLWKPYNDTKPLRMSSKPVPQADVIKTICDEFGLALNDEYARAFGVEEEMPRTRRYLTFCGSHLGEPQGYFPELKEFVANGRMHDFMSLVPTFVRFAPGRKILTPLLEAGSILDFRKGGNYFGYTSLVGWSWPYRDVVWNYGESAGLYLPMKTQGQSVRIAIRCRPFIGATSQTRQRMRVIDSRENVLFDGELREPTTVVFEVPHEAFLGNLIALRFEFPNAAIRRNSITETNEGRSVGFEYLTIMR